MAKRRRQEHKVLLSLEQIVGDHIQKAIRDLHELIGYARLRRDRSDRSGRRVVTMSLRPFFWEPLPAEAKPIHAQLRRGFQELHELLLTIFAGQRKRGREEIERALERLSDVIELDRSEHDTPEAALRAACDAFEKVFRFVEESGEGNEDEALIVPDTSALYAEPRLEEWEFAEWQGQFVIVLVPAVISELDKHKGHHPNDAIMKRAQRLVRQIGDYRQRGRLVDGVTLRNQRSRIRAWPREPNMASSLPWLDSDTPDDRLLASALSIAQSATKSPVALVTDDTNLHTKCELAHFSCLWPPQVRSHP